MTERLTSLAAVKEWLNITTDDSDAALVRVIDAVSQFILAYIGWDTFRRSTYTYQFRGFGKDSVLLRAWPVLSITSVAQGGNLLQPSTFSNGMPSTGYYVNGFVGGMQSLILQGGHFANGVPAQVVYEAGFETTQTALIPDEPYTFTPTNDGVWSLDLGVTIDGVEAVAVLADPQPGEYLVDDWGQYTFNAADKGKTAVFSYSYTPSAISFAACEMVAEWFKRKDRIGILSKTLGGQETVTFSHQDMNMAAKSILQPFMNVVPA